MSIKCNERGSAMMYISLNQLEQVYFTNTYAYIFVIVNTLLEPNVLWHYTCSSKYIEPMVLKFSQTQYLFSLTFYFLYNPRFAHIKGFSTPKKTHLFWLHVHQNKSKIIPCTLFLFNSKCQTLCVIFSEKTARFPTEIFG